RSRAGCRTFRSTTSRPRLAAPCSSAPSSWRTRRAVRRAPTRSFAIPVALRWRSGRKLEAAVTYVLLIYRATEVGKEPPGLDERATLRAHGKLQREAAAHGDLHAVARLEESRDARTVRR